MDYVKTIVKKKQQLSLRSNRYEKRDILKLQNAENERFSCSSALFLY